MATEPSAVEQAVSRTLRENLESIQRTSDELHRAVGDLVAACASSRSLNALPPMVRAQMASASLSATLDVLARLITAAIQPMNRGLMDAEAFRLPPSSSPEPLPASKPPEARFAEPKIPEPVAEPVLESAPAVEVPVQRLPPIEVSPAPQVLSQESVKVEIPVQTVPSQPQAPVVQAPVVQPPQPSSVEAVINLVVEAVQNAGGLHAAQEALAAQKEPAAEIVAPIPAPHVAEPILHSVIEPVAVSPASEDDSLWAPGSEFTEELDAAPPTGAVPVPVMEIVNEPAAESFDITSLPIDQQELHRRANRVAKVSMQDIKMLRPDDVRLGRLNHDLCTRLRDDIEKAHKEYDRRFQSINSHPVDYFYNWMVEILAEGDSEALGDYPYPTAVLRR